MATTKLNLCGVEGLYHCCYSDLPPFCVHCISTSPGFQFYMPLPTHFASSDIIMVRYASRSNFESIGSVITVEKKIREPNHPKNYSRTASLPLLQEDDPLPSPIPEFRLQFSSQVIPKLANSSSPPSLSPYPPHSHLPPSPPFPSDSHNAQIKKKEKHSPPPPSVLLSFGIVFFAHSALAFCIRLD